MRKVQTTNDGCVIRINDEYFLVDELSYRLLHYYYLNYDIEQVAGKMGRGSEEIKSLYNKISDLISQADYEKEKIEFKSPLKVQWKITDNCNLRCKHCYIGEKDDLNQKQELIIDKIFNKLINSNILEITISGGEALLVKKLPVYVQKFTSKNISVKIFTNGTLLKRFISKLGEDIDKSLLTFEVSLDGIKKIHDYIRGTGTFDITIDNIKYAIENGFKIMTNTVLNKMNSENNIELFNYLHHLGVNSIQLSNLIMMGWAKDNSKELQMSKEEVNNFYKRVKEEIKFKFYYADPETDDVYIIDSKNEEKVGKNSWTCCAGTARLTIEHNGNVIICPFLRSSVLGNLATQELEDIWNNTLRLKCVQKIQQMNKGKRCFAISGLMS